MDGWEKRGVLALRPEDCQVFVILALISVILAALRLKTGGKAGKSWG